MSDTATFHKAPKDERPTAPVPEGASTPNDVEDDMLIDTSKMGEGKRDAMEVAESARTKEWAQPSFARQLFMGNLDLQLMAPFPGQHPDDQAIGNELCAKVQAALLEHIDPDAVDETREIPETGIDALKALGVFAMKVPTQYGGLGLSQMNYNRVMQLIASHCASTAVLVSAHQSIGVPQPLKLFGTAEQKQKYLPMIAEGAVSAFALTEPGVGSDPARMQTYAELSEDGSHWILNGEKLWCTNGPIADLLVVMARTPAKVVNGRERTQISAFIVEKDFGGIEMVHRCDFMGLRGIHNGLLRFHDVKVPRDNLILGEGKGLKLALQTLNTGRLTVPAACTGVAKQCLQVARRWGLEREQWGLNIGRHEAGAAKIAEIAATTFAMEAVWRLTSQWADRDDVDIRMEAAMAKLFSSEACWRISDLTVALRGGRGYEKGPSLRARGEHPWPVERWLRDSRINTIIEGTTDIMRLFLAREAMDPHLQVAKDLLKREGSLSTKLSAGMKLAGFYSTWYPHQWINGSLWHGHVDMGPLAEHMRYAERTAHKLARSIFHAMGQYQDRLERKQRLLAHLMEIGTELFVQCASCSFALSLPHELEPIHLADAFCRQSQERIRQHFDALHHNTWDTDQRLARAVLEDRCTWLEEGTVPLPEREGAALETEKGAGGDDSTA